MTFLIFLDPAGMSGSKCRLPFAEMSAFEFIQCKKCAKPEISAGASAFLLDKSAGATGFLDVSIRAPAEMSGKYAIERE